MQDFSYFDLITLSIICILGIKGFFNGFFKEFFGLVGIIGGIFLGSRYSNQIGDIIDKSLFNFENKAVMSFVGFIIILASFWFAMNMIGLMFKKISKISNLASLDRIGGFILGGGKIFLIFSVIVFSISQISIISKVMKPIMNNSIMYATFLEVGNAIIKIENVKSMQSSIDNASDKITQTISSNLKEETENSLKDIKDSVINNSLKMKEKLLNTQDKKD